MSNFERTSGSLAFTFEINVHDSVCDADWIISELKEHYTHVLESADAFVPIDGASFYSLYVEGVELSVKTDEDFRDEYEEFTKEKL